MIRNYFLSSLRSILKDKTSLLLNLFGLTLGLSACLIAYLHISYEHSYDDHMLNKHQVFRVIAGGGHGGYWPRVSSPVAPKLQAELPEVVSYARITPHSYDPKVTVRSGDKIFNESNFYLADPALLAMFSINMLQGPQQPLQSPEQVIISRAMASKYFGDDNPIGQELKVDSRSEYVVSGVFEDIPFNSHIDIDFIVPFENLERVKPGTRINGNWRQFNYYTYVQLEPSANPFLVDLKMKEIVAEFADGTSIKFERLGLQAAADIHFQASRGNAKKAYDAKYLLIFGSIAVGILLISFINFVNLSIAGSTRRIKEVGLRKVVGASRGQLVSQFILEGFIVALGAGILALVLSRYVFLEQINGLLNTNLYFNPWDLEVLGPVLLLTVVIALAAGSYISVFILTFHPITAIKGTVKIGNKGKFFKSALLTTQFAISSFLILSTWIVYQQLQHMRDSDLGLEQDGIVNVQLYNEASLENVTSLKAAFMQIPGVERVCASRFTPGQPNWQQTVHWSGIEEELNFFLIEVDEDFIETYGLELIQGDLDQIKSSQLPLQYILNETAAQYLKQEQVVGIPFSAHSKDRMVPISGVVKDFNYKSLHNAIEPLALVVTADRVSQISVSFNTTDIRGLMQLVEATYAGILPNSAFEYAFADAQFDNLYRAEMQTGRLIGILTVIAIMLALLGLYGLLSYALKERTKEIAIRKILGIDLGQVFRLLSKGYIGLMIIANVVAVPLALLAVERWLENFNYRITPGALSFVVTISCMILLLLLIVGSKVFQTQKINPVKALRYE